MSTLNSKDLGSGHTGFHDWYWQRISAALLLLILPTIFGLVMALYAGKIDFFTLHHWFTNGFVKSLATLSVAIIGLHMWTGLKVIFEDYIHTSAGRLVILNLLLVGLVVTGLYLTYSIWAEVSYPFSCIACTTRGT